MNLFYRCLRSSGSEPLHIKNQQQRQSQHLHLTEKPLHTGSNNQSVGIKYNLPFFSKSNLIKSDSKKSNNSPSHKDNQSINHSLNNCNISMKNIRRKLLASSDSDFLSIIRNNSEKLRKNNFNSKSKNNLIYALSDSDFFISASEQDGSCGVKNKNLNMNILCKNHEAILSNKSDIFKLLLTSKNVDYKNLVENSLTNKNVVECSSKIDKPDILIDLLYKQNTQKLCKDLDNHIVNIQKTKSEENNAKDSDQGSNLDFIDFDAIQVPAVSTSLPPCIITQDFDAGKHMLSTTSKSIDTLHCQPIVENNFLNPVGKEKYLAISDTSTISLDLVNIPKKVLLLPEHTTEAITTTMIEITCDKLMQDADVKQAPDIIEINTNKNSSNNGILSASKFGTPAKSNSETANGSEFNSGLVHRKRQSSTVTYNGNY